MKRWRTFSGLVEPPPLARALAWGRRPRHAHRDKCARRALRAGALLPLPLPPRPARPDAGAGRAEEEVRPAAPRAAAATPGARPLAPGLSCEARPRPQAWPGPPQPSPPAMDNKPRNAWSGRRKQKRDRFSGSFPSWLRIGTSRRRLCAAPVAGGGPCRGGGRVAAPACYPTLAMELGTRGP